MQNLVEIGVDTISYNTYSEDNKGGFMKIHLLKKSIILFSCFMFVFMMIPKKNVKALGGVTPNFVACIEELGVYSETVAPLVLWEQFGVDVLPSVVPSHPYHEVTYIATIGITVGASADFNLFKVKTKVSFELSLVGTREEKIGVTWDVPASNRTIHLSAGKYRRVVTGTITDTYVDCEVDSRVIKVTGTTGSYYNATYK